MTETGKTSDAFDSSLGAQGQDLANRAADKAQAGIDSAANAVDRVADEASDKVDEWKNKVTPTLDTLGDRAQRLFDQGQELYTDTSGKVKAIVGDASDAAIEYTRAEPIKALLIAAGTGALLMSLISLLARSRD